MTKDEDRQRQVDELATQLIAESGGIDGLLMRLGVAPGLGTPELKPPTLLPRRNERAGYVLRVELDGITPPIWRRVRVPSDLTLRHFHEVIQSVVGWSDSHLHAFLMGPGERTHDVAPFITEADIAEGEEGTPEAEVRLDEVLTRAGDRLYYDYDFGDQWEHTITLEAVETWVEGDRQIRCLAGERACAPEDVGGVPGYEELLNVLAGRTQGLSADWGRTLRDWAGEGYDPEHFDIDEANEALDALEWPTMDGWRADVLAIIVRMSHTEPELTRRLAAGVASQPLASDEELHEAMADLLLLLDAVGGDGIKLTQAGYLPPKTVKELFAGLSAAARGAYPFAPTTEVHTAPVHHLRVTAVDLGLARKYKGSLVLTQKGRVAAGSPAQMWRAIVDAVPLGRRDYEADAGLIEMLGVAGGLRRWDDGELLALLFHAAGWRSDGPIVRAYLEASSSTSLLLGMLGRRAGVAARLIRDA